MTITEFLTARYDEREAAAREASAGPWAVRPNGDSPWVTRQGQPDVWLAITSPDPGASKAANADHIALNDPAHVLADIAAKRAIVASVVSGEAHEVAETMSGLRQVVARDVLSSVLRLLAQPYAAHEDFDEAWRTW